MNSKVFSFGAAGRGRYVDRMLVRFLYGLLVLVFFAAGAIMYRYSRPTPALSLPGYAIKNGCHYAGLGDIEIVRL